MLTRKELENIFRKYWDIDPFKDGEMAGIEASRIAEEGFEHFRRQLCDKLESGKLKLVSDMLSYQSAMEKYHNIYYLWQGYLWGREENSSAFLIDKPPGK